jgi:DNA processing protein
VTALSPDERLHWLRLSRTPRVGPVTFRELIRRFGTPDRAILAFSDLSRTSKIPLRAPSVAEITQEIANVENMGGQIIASCETAFPAALKALDPPPPVLTVLGRTDLLARPCIAIVGARNASAAGRKIAREMAAELGANGLVIVSGLARGIDGEAHAATLETGTVAVVAGGVDHIYPREHEDLRNAIAAKGAIVSECAFGHSVTAKDFPRRNRLVTGLSLGVVVVEAAERSGSLISARTAAEQGRDVMAVPGSPLDPRARGSNGLIRQGAYLVESAKDVLDILSGARSLAEPQHDAFEPDPFQSIEAEMPDPRALDRLREALSYTPVSLDELARSSGLSAPQVRACLMELELGGEAVTLAGGLAVRATD